MLLVLDRVQCYFSPQNNPSAYRSCPFQVLAASHAEPAESRFAAVRSARLKMANDQPPQCDGSRPVCQRCVKAHRICHGARQAFSILNDENPYASGQKKRPRGPRSATQIQPPSDRCTALPQLPFDLQAEALASFAQCFLTTIDDAPGIVKGVMDDVLHVWTSRPDCQILDLAIETVALAVFAYSKKYPPAALKASAKYQRLLPLLQRMLFSLDQDNIEVCLLAVVLMSMYEDATYQPPSDSQISFSMGLQSIRHQDGISAILKFWKDHLSGRFPVTSVIKHVRRSTAKLFLIRKLAFPDWMRDGTSFDEYGLELEYDTLVVRIASMRERVSTLLECDIKTETTRQKIISTARALDEEAQDIDQMLQDWISHFPNSWQYSRHVFPDTIHHSKECFYSPILHSYESLVCASVWTRYYSHRMLVNSTRLGILQLLEADTDDFSSEQRSECLSNVKGMANDLASTIPFCFERFKIEDGSDSLGNRIRLNTTEGGNSYIASLLILPMVIASGIKYTDIEQQLWFRTQLTHVGKILGSGILDFASKSNWIDF